MDSLSYNELLKIACDNNIQCDSKDSRKDILKKLKLTVNFNNATDNHDNNNNYNIDNDNNDNSNNDNIIDNNDANNNGKSKEYLPIDYTCYGSSLRPKLKWYNKPVNTKSFLFLLEDPDSLNGTFVHWLVYNIPGSVSSIELDSEFTTGINSEGHASYTPACPPDSSSHRYIFKLYALSSDVLLPPNLDKQQVFSMIKNNIISYTQSQFLYP